MAVVIGNDNIEGGNPIMWAPSIERRETSALARFMAGISRKYGVEMADYGDIYDWSIENMADFWSEVWDFCGIIGEKGGEILVDADRMQDARFFPEARLNFAENLLRRRDDSVALVFRGEDKVEYEVSWNELYDKVSQLAAVMKDLGVAKGVRVAGYMPNMPETIMAMLAATSLGAIWSSASPDFGVEGVIDRFGQIEPKILFCANGYYYGGKEFDCLGKLSEIMGRLPSVEKVIIVPYTKQKADISGVEKAVHWADILADYEPKDIEFVRTEFNHPLYIMFSSGTTGAPKCITHGVGGTLLQQVKEHSLHCDNKAGDKVFFFTTCGWMMWNWLVAGLAVEATLMLYDGSPFYPSGEVLFDYMDDYKIDFFGTSAKFIDALRGQGFEPNKTHDLASLKVLASTGSPLVAESYDYIYSSIKADIQVASISGGTDIVSCFVLANPLQPVRRGEIMGRGLGMAVEVYNDEGKPVIDEKGEMVCVKPFPSMPVGFWGDDDGKRYKAAYFETYDNIWHHGDYVAITAEGGMVIYGRSDATLNPGGVRIGTAEIYRAVEQMDEVVESIAIGQEWDNDVRVVLFVILAKDVVLDDALIKAIKTQVRTKCTPRHMPAVVVAVKDIPRTKSGKITEIAVRDVVHGRAVKNVESLANPEALEEFRGLAELR